MAHAIIAEYVQFVIHNVYGMYSVAQRMYLINHIYGIYMYYILIYIIIIIFVINLKIP